MDEDFLSAGWLYGERGCRDSSSSNEWGVEPVAVGLDLGGRWLLEEFLVLGRFGGVCIGVHTGILGMDSWLKVFGKLVPCCRSNGASLLM